MSSRPGRSHGPNVRVVNGTRHEGRYASGPNTLEDPMIGRTQIPRDPFEGSGAYRKRLRLRTEGVIAVSLAIAACGLTAAMWFKTLLPVFDRVF